MEWNTYTLTSNKEPYNSDHDVYRDCDQSDIQLLAATACVMEDVYTQDTFPGV